MRPLAKTRIAKSIENMTDFCLFKNFFLLILFCIVVVKPSTAPIFKKGKFNYLPKRAFVS